MSLVRHLPETDKSSYFGLPPNIDVTVQYNESVYLSSRLKGKTALIAKAHLKINLIAFYRFSFLSGFSSAFSWGRKNSYEQTRSYFLRVEVFIAGCTVDTLVSIPLSHKV